MSNDVAHASPRSTAAQDSPGERRKGIRDVRVCASYRPVDRPSGSRVELASGLGLIRDAVTIAHDASASLSQKVALFGALAVMTPQDRDRLEGLLAAMEAHQAWRETRRLFLLATSTRRLSAEGIARRRWPRAAALSRSRATTATARTVPMAHGRARE
jgi:hypothetical protein